MLTFASEYLTRKLCQSVVGQEAAVESIVTAVCENFEAFALGKPLKLNNVLVMGPTGSGKTEIARSIAKTLEVPFVRTTMSDFTLTGYRGRDPQEIVTVDLKEILTENHCEVVNKLKSNYFFRNKAVEILKSLDISPLEFKVALEFCTTTVFFNEDEVVEYIFSRYGRNKNIINAIDDTRFLIKEVERSFKSLGPVPMSFQTFKQKPFGIVFIDEIDKILIKERGDGAYFYRPIQEFILTMVEGAIVTSERDYEKAQIDTSHVTFVLSGAFSEHSPDEFIPELKGRLNVKVKVRKLKFEDYLKIAKLHKFDVPEVLKDKLVVVEPSAMVEIAKVCEELNEREYLGARRLREIVSKVNLAIKRELRITSSFPITVDADFVRWAVSFEPPYEDFVAHVPKGNRGSQESLKRIPKVRIKKQIRDSLIKELVSRYTKLLVDHRGSLEFTVLSLFSKSHLIRKDSSGKSVLEYLLERGVIKRIAKSTFESLRQALGGEVADRMLKVVEVVDDEESELEELEF